MSVLALWLAVGVLGGLGASARALLGRLVAGGDAARFPLATLTVNVTGSAILGVLVGASVTGDAYLLSGTAVIGSYTTFSTWVFETHGLAQRGRRGPAALNLLVSLLAGIGAVAVGRLVA